jgi:hypothetical protein
MAETGEMLRRALRRVGRRGEAIGLLGRAEADGSYTIEADDDPGRVYVRLLLGDEAVTLVTAWGSIARIANTRVRLARGRRGEWRIVGVDDGYEAAQFGETAGAGVEQHSHRRGAGLEYVVEGELFEPGRVAPLDADSLFVRVAPCFYSTGADTLVSYAGENLNLAAHVPGATLHRYVLVTLDPAANAAAATPGAARSITVPLLDADLAAIPVPAGHLPLGGVRLSGGQTRFTDFRDFRDCRRYVSGSVVSVGAPSPWANGGGYVYLPGGERVMLNSAAAPDDAAALQIDGANRGFLTARVTTLQKLAIPAPQGLLVYDVSQQHFNGYEGQWDRLAWERVLRHNLSLEQVTGVAETTILADGEITLSPAFWTRFRGLRVYAGGTFTVTASNASLRLRCRLQGLEIASNGAPVLPNPSTGVAWALRAEITVRNISASSQVRGVTEFSYGAAGAGRVDFRSASVDLTVNRNFTVQALWGTSGNTLNCEVLTVEAIPRGI